MDRKDYMTTTDASHRATGQTDDWTNDATREDLLQIIAAQTAELMEYHELRKRAFAWCRAETMLTEAGATTSLHDKTLFENGVPLATLTERGVPTKVALQIAIEVAEEATTRLWRANGGSPIRFGFADDRPFELRRLATDANLPLVWSET